MAQSLTLSWLSTRQPGSGAAEDMAGTVPGQVVMGIGGEMVKGFSTAIANARERPGEQLRESVLRNMPQVIENLGLTLLQVADAGWQSPASESVRWGWVPSSSMECKAVGFPVALAQPDDSREPEHVPGASELLTSRVNGQAGDQNQLGRSHAGPRPDAFDRDVVGRRLCGGKACGGGYPRPAGVRKLSAGCYIGQPVGRATCAWPGS